MGEKIIQPPFYNSGFYNTGAGGGGGGGNVDRFFNNFIQSAGDPDPIVLDNAETNKDVFIKVNFVKTNTTSRTILELLTNEDVRVSRVYISSSGKYVSNSSAAGDNTAWGVDRNPNVITICNGSYRAQYGWSFSDGGCQFVENSFKKIQLNGGVSYQQIAIYRAVTFGVKPSEYIHNFVPYFVDNTDKGLIDEVTGIKYPLLHNTHVY